MNAAPDHAHARRRAHGIAAAARRGLEHAADALLARAAAPAARRKPHLPRVLAYHDIDSDDAFTQHVAYLQAAFHPVSPDAFLEAAAGRATLPGGAVLLTFDDGHRGVYERGLPILSSAGVPAVLFVVAGLLNSCRPFWWDEVKALVAAGPTASRFSEVPAGRVVSAMKAMPDPDRRELLDRMRRSVPVERHPTYPQLTAAELRELANAGIEIGNHTWTHPCLDRCPFATLEHEIVRAHDRLTAILERPPRLFAYPNGNYDARAARLLKELGYAAGFVFDHRIGIWPPERAFRISRLRVNATNSINRFRIILNGVHPALHHALGRS